MGQKVSPVGFRVGVIRDWESRWYAEKDQYGTLLQEDIKIRELLEKECKDYRVARVEIERSGDKVTLIIRTASSGMFVGADGSKIEDLKKKLAKICGEKTLDIKIVDIANPDLDATLVAQRIAKMLEERQSFRTAQKKTIQQVMRSGAKGIKTKVSGRLGGADIARTEGYSEGIVPLHTLRSDIDFAIAEAATTYGRLGVKVWICRGEVLPGEMVKEPEKPKNNDRQRRDRRDRRDRRPNQQAAAKVETVKEEVKEVKEVVETKEGE